MPVVNGDFEIPGEHGGIPSGWTIRALCQTRQHAAFAGIPRLGLELFAWSLDPDAVIHLESATFDALPETVEDFFEGWLLPRTVYLKEMTLAIGGDPFADSFVWGFTIIDDWGDVPDVEAAADEGFEIDNYVTEWGDVDDDAASFDGPVSVEDFSAVDWPEL
jgi:hypothetical protein